jgi:hypothetical protein
MPNLGRETCRLLSKTRICLWNTSRGLKTKAVQQIETFSPSTFRENAFNAQRPTRLSPDQLTRLPAAEKWFIRNKDNSFRLNETYLIEQTVLGQNFPLEMTHHTGGVDKFEQISAPLDFFVRFSNRDDTTLQNNPERLYLAQVPLSELPIDLQYDLPTPELVKSTGQGDIYGSSIWIGRSPTYTPLHRDPNPNLHIQLAGSKVIRLFEPQVGRQIYLAAKAKLGGYGFTSEKFRGSEMMEGQEKRLLDEAVWIDPTEIPYEVVLERGEAIFIPLGWWHSVKSVGPGVIGSVNWWFR